MLSILQPSQSPKAENVRSSNRGASSLSKQKFELHRKLEEEQRLYKERLEAYKALQNKKTLEREPDQVRRGLVFYLYSENKDADLCLCFSTGNIHLSPNAGKLVFRVSHQGDTNWPIVTRKRARSLKSCTEVEEGLYYLCSEK